MEGSKRGWVIVRGRVATEFCLLGHLVRGAHNTSSIENSPPATIKALKRNQAKIMKETIEFSEKMKRNLTRTFGSKNSEFVVV
ncbi:uncharacterized protein BDV14DRAFT_148182 [Aspergillus stella-maris]|uniref:uncharacterized protein n=1 Tax=Aspergillus stella-maris TaxID=1810926 RepID=UPI003CCD2BC8